ncbi:hypothetical protein Cgig2_001598 [Carnegiea gigantea]|uniref:Poly A polymerase head domain-containing protein n=1 Tax=Carnegiea gigantea TaxID=171969 RepID=A0A9Q1QFB5_9CARY|nr:hypothetical protein Cgig2_001598 [Carnegiea gigantea]
MDSRKLGISLSMIPEASRIFVKVLQNEGYDAYLVGGCVRDLLLSKTPKDFDVITTATLQEIKENFRRAFIVRGRFPICRVHVKGSTIEVSNFETAARDAEEKEDVQLSTLSERYDQQDIMRWRNSLQWDFTINSLFYDPFADTIYDYSSRMTDLTFLKLRTLIPANLSFKEDCGRWFALLLVILAEHSKDTEKEIRTLYASVATLKKAAYLASQSGARNPSMLMVFISKNAGRQVAHIFGVLMDDIESLEPERHYYSIDYKSLGKGDIVETRTVSPTIKLALEKKQFQAPKLVVEQVEVERSTSMVSELETSKSKHSVERGSGEPDEPSQQGPKKQKKNEKTCNKPKR